MGKLTDALKNQGIKVNTSNTTGSNSATRKSNTTGRYTQMVQDASIRLHNLNPNLKLNINEKVMEEANTTNTSDYVFSSVEDNTIWGKMYNAITYPLRTNKDYVRSRMLDLTDESWYYYNNLNDTAMNSLADVIAYNYYLTPHSKLSDNFKIRSYEENVKRGKETMEQYNATVPKRYAALSEWLTRTLAEPIKQAYDKNGIIGSYLIMNNLGSFGETVDMFSFANLIKAIHANSITQRDNNSKNILENIKAGYLGYTSVGGVSGRKQYDADLRINFDGDPNKATTAENIANGALNLAIEIISDPVNMGRLISGGVSGTNLLIGKRTNKNVATAINSSESLNILKDEVYNIAKKSGVIQDDATFVSELNKAFSFSPSDTKGILKADLKGEIAGKAIKDIPEEDLGAFVLKNIIYKRMDNSDALRPLVNIFRTGELKGEGLDIVGTVSKKVINELRDSSLANLNYKVIRSASTINDILTDYDNITTAFAGAPLFTPVVHAARYMVPGVFHIFSTAITKASKGATVTVDNIKTLDVFKANKVLSEAKTHLKNLESQLDEGAASMLNDKFIDNYLQELTEISTAYQLQKLSEVLLKGGEDEATLKELQNLIELFTKNNDDAPCKTIREYLDKLVKIYEDEDNAILIQKLHIPDHLITKLEILADIEDSLINRSESYRLLKKLQDFVDVDLELVDDASASIYKALKNDMNKFSEYFNMLQLFIDHEGETVHGMFISDKTIKDAIDKIVEAYQTKASTFSKKYKIIREDSEAIQKIIQQVSDRLNMYVSGLPKGTVNFDKRGVYRIGTVYKRLVNSWIKLGNDLSIAKTNAKKVSLMRKFIKKLNDFDEILYHYEKYFNDLDDAKKVSDELQDVFNKLKTPISFYNEIYDRIVNGHSSGFIRKSGIDDSVPIEKVKDYLDFRALDDAYKFLHDGSYDPQFLKKINTVGDVRKLAEKYAKKIESYVEKLKSIGVNDLDYIDKKIESHMEKLTDLDYFDSYKESIKNIIKEADELINTLNKFDTTFELLEWKNESLVLLHTEGAARSLEILSDSFIPKVQELFNSKTITGKYFLDIIHDNTKPKSIVEILNEILVDSTTPVYIKNNINDILKITEPGGISSTVRKLISDKNTPKELKDVLQKSIVRSTGVPENLKNILRDIKGQLDYIETLRTWYQSSSLAFTNPAKFTAFIESIENFANTGLSDLNNFNVAEAIAFRMQMNLDRIFNVKGSASLGMYRGRLAMTLQDDDFINIFRKVYGDNQELLQRMISNAHTDSGIDVRVTELVNEYLSELFKANTDKQHYDVLSKVKKLIEDTDKTYAYFDIETVNGTNRTVSELNKFTGSISQFTLMFSNDDMITYVLKGDVDAGNVDLSLFSNNVEICLDEIDLLNKVQEKILNNKAIYLFGQNSDRFDLPFIQQRLLSSWKDIAKTKEDLLKLKKTSVFFDMPLDYSDDNEALIFKDILHSYNTLYDIPIVTTEDVSTIKKLISNYFDAAYESGSNTVNGLDYRGLLNNINQTYTDYLKYIENGVSKNEKDIVNNCAYILEELSNLAKEKKVELTESSRWFMNAASIDTYGNPLGKTYVRNVFKEHADITKIKELAEKLQYSKDPLLYEDALLNKMVNELGYTKEEIIKYLNNRSGIESSLNESELEAFGKTIDNWWQEYYFYAYLKKFGETEEDFFKILRGKREHLTSLLNAGTEVGSSSKVSYRSMIDNIKFRETKYFDLDRISEYISNKVIDQLRNEQKAITDLVDRRIKDVKNMYSLGLGFDDITSLRSKTEELLNELNSKYKENSWAYYVDLNNFQTDSQLAALWYRLMVFKRYINRASKDAVAAQDKYIDMLQTALLNKFDANVLSAKRMTWLEDFAYDDLPLEIKLDSEVYHSMNASERALDYIQSFDYIPGAGANEFAHRVLLEDSKILARHCVEGIYTDAKLDKVPISGSSYTVEMNKVFSECTHDIFSQHIINKILDEDFDYIISKLLYDDLFYTFDISQPMKRMFSDSPEYIYYKTVNQLLDHADAFAERGVIIKQGLDQQVIVGLSSEGIVDVSGTERAFRGIKYTQQAPLLFQIKKPEYSILLDEDIERLNKILRYNYEDGSMGFGHSLMKADAENAYKWAGITETNSLGIRTLEQRLNEKFFDNGVIYNNSNLTNSRAYRSGSSYNIVNLFKSTGYITNRKTDFNLFLDIFFNPNSEMQASNIFKGLSEQEILNAVKNNDNIVFARLVQDNSKQGFHIRKIDIETTKNVKYVLNKDNNVVMVPYQVYSSAFDAINTTANAHSKFYNFWHNYVVHTFKIPYFMSIGTVLRNVIDSNLKAWIDTGDPTGMIKNTIQSLQDYKNYSKTIEGFYNWLPTAERYFQDNTTGFNQYFKYLSDNNITPPMKQSDFFRIHGFINNGPSAGTTLTATKAKNKYLREDRKRAKEQGIEIPKKKIPEKVKNTRGAFDNFLLAPMSIVEQNVRYAEYLTWLEQGVTKTQAFQEVSKTAFNYSLKSDSAAFLEQIIPFYNFQKLNLFYWVRTVSDNAWLAKLLEDALQTGYDTYNLSYDDYNTNRSIQYHINAGNIQLNDDGLILKLNPSYMDALNILMEPITIGLGINKGIATDSPILGIQKWAQESNVLSSVLSPIQVAIEYTLEELSKDEYLKAVPFGKYKDKPIEFLLEDRNYVQRLLDSDYSDKMKQYYPSVYQKLIDSLNYQPRYISFGQFKDNPQPAAILLEPENRGYAQILLGSEISENPWLSTYYKPIYDMLIANGLNNDPVMPWGKYKGQLISEVPQTYKEYLMNSVDIYGNYWLYDSWPYLYDIFSGTRNTILPEDTLVTDTVISTPEALGILYYSALENPESAKATWDNFKENFITDPSIYPWWNVISSKLSTSANIKDRLDTDNEIYKTAASLFPTVFSAIKNNETYKQNEKYANTVKNFYTNTTTPQKKPWYSSQNMAQQASNAKKTYNYYSPKKGYYTPAIRKAYKKYNKKYGDVVGLQLNIAQLKLRV